MKNMKNKLLRTALSLVTACLLAKDVSSPTTPMALFSRPLLFSSRLWGAWSGWFMDHKQDYQNHLLSPTRALAEQVYDAIHEGFPDEPFLLKMSRIYRDARRLHGSSGRNGSPKQVENVGTGSVTPISVPATLEVKPDTK